MNTSPSPLPLLQPGAAGGKRSPLPPLASNDKEKVVPFLRQLVEMLTKNEELISFSPGRRLPDGSAVLARIVIHDRARVQSEILPVYFNHASFASLRRQLSYFSFVRVGRGRRPGASYTNESVVELEDILRLRRRSVGKQKLVGGGEQVQMVPRECREGRLQPRPTRQPQQQQHRAQHQQKQQKPQQHQYQQQLQEERQLQQQTQHQQQQRDPKSAATSAEVASALLSGELHAAKTNQSLDSSSNGNEYEGPPPLCRASSDTQSSITGSCSLTSSSVVTIKTARKNDGRGPGKARARKRRSYVPSYKMRPGERKKFDRLLAINRIVPFIHLPTGYVLPGRTRGGGKKARRKSRPRDDIVAQSGVGAVDAADALLSLGVNRGYDGTSGLAS